MNNAADPDLGSGGEAIIKEIIEFVEEDIIFVDCKNNNRNEDKENLSLNKRDS